MVAYERERTDAGNDAEEGASQDSVNLRLPSFSVCLNLLFTAHLSFQSALKTMLIIH